MPVHPYSQKYRPGTEVLAKKEDRRGYTGEPARQPAPQQYSALIGNVMLCCKRQCADGGAMPCGALRESVFDSVNTRIASSGAHGKE